MRLQQEVGFCGGEEFPRLRAGTFIEARIQKADRTARTDFPALGRGLSLRQLVDVFSAQVEIFPRLRAGTFIEAQRLTFSKSISIQFPRLRAGTFIEASRSSSATRLRASDFPALGRGLSLRPPYQHPRCDLRRCDFPALGRGLSLRHDAGSRRRIQRALISPP